LKLDRGTMKFKVIGFKTGNKSELRAIGQFH